jgi:regulator of nucleoside diphosphate kinase
MKQIISETDYKRIHTFLSEKKAIDGKNLTQRLTNALIIKEADMDAKIIRLNSYIEVQNLVLGKIIKLKIVMPDCVDLKTHQVSVLSPISLALLGYRERDLIQWKMPTGNTSFKILSVINESL